MEGVLETIDTKFTPSAEKWQVTISFDVIGIRALRKKILSEYGTEQIKVRGTRSKKDGRYSLEVAVRAVESDVWQVVDGYRRELVKGGAEAIVTQVDLPPSMRKILIKEQFLSD